MAGPRVYPINVAELTNDHSFFRQLTNHGDPYTVKDLAFLIDHPAGTALFDTGISAEMVAAPEDYGAYGTPEMVERAERLDVSAEDTVVSRIAELGYAPGDVDCVVVSHLHFDHAGTISEFPDAEFLIQQEELQHAFWPRNPSQRDMYLEGDFGVLRTDRFSVTALEGRSDVFGDGTLELVPTPGHTPGHQSLVVRLEDEGTVVLAADVANTWSSYEDEQLASFNWNNDEAIRSVRRVKAIARREDARVVISHDDQRFDELPPFGTPLD